MKDFKTIVVAYGDGIGPEIMEATLEILRKAGARINIEAIEIGEKLYSKGILNGISPDAWNKVFEHKVLLKAPITTPQGKGYKSLNVTFRKALGLYANVRPCVSFYPFAGKHDTKMDLVVCRENEEDLYAGIEYRPARNTAIAHKMITRNGSEKIIRYAFEYAVSHGRKKVTCMVKDNIMKIADGMFHDVFNAVAAEYKEIESNSMIVDIGSARIASRPADFDVIVTLNLYGDIISDIAAEVSGSIGLAGSSNIGEEYAMFEAVHGSAPLLAGKNRANPSGLLNGAVLMLEHIGQYDVAAKVKNAWLKTIEDGIHTHDIYREGVSSREVGTKEFAEAVMANLGQEPTKLAKYEYSGAKVSEHKRATLEDKSAKQLIGADLLLDATGRELEEVASVLKDIHKDFKLHLISQRGLKVWPDSSAKKWALETIRCRFIGYADTGASAAMVAELFTKVATAGFDIAAMCSLYTYDGQIGFTLAQGE